LSVTYNKRQNPYLLRGTKTDISDRPRPGEIYKVDGKCEYDGPGDIYYLDIVIESERCPMTRFGIRKHDLFGQAPGPPLQFMLSRIER
jgi:hypothetical protein